MINYFLSLFIILARNALNIFNFFSPGYGDAILSLGLAPKNKFFLPPFGGHPVTYGRGVPWGCTLWGIPRRGLG